MTPYHVNVNSAYAFFVRLIFIAAINHEKIFIMKISSFTVPGAYEGKEHTTYIVYNGNIEK